MKLARPLELEPRQPAAAGMTLGQQGARIVFRKATRIAVGRDHLLNTIEFCIAPLVSAVSLWAVAAWYEGYLAPHYVILSIIVFSLMFPGSAHLTRSPWSVVRHILAGWGAVSGLLFLFGVASGYLEYFDRRLLLTWWWVAPMTEFGAHMLLRLAAPKVIALQGTTRRAVVAGLNAQSLELATRLSADPYLPVRVVGFFDDRNDQRVNQPGKHALLGGILALPRFARDHQIDLIYISLPMASQPRILLLLDELRDTTASIYFVPDVFVTDLIQGRIDSVGGLPVVAVCDTPYSGLDGILKRTADMVLSSLILILLSIPLLVIALAVKISSPGPAIFKQRRYGLDGQEIIVYKFRTMSVTEDGATIEQAHKLDPRVTPLGRFLRRTSLDEFPQFLNVLQGHMSIVGPRPHAVAHNELYRKLIKGYMQRHKVKPGITGWAQVNGYRGETESLEKMKGRIDFDLEYLRNWSLRFDFYIIARTIWVVLSQKNAC
jgi:putative colanic acid biosysnthesis UDP-glucose lipid carrier transferase